MSASYPQSLKTFSSVVDGVTKLVAALFNSPYDEITAIETMLGVMGRNQGYSDSFKNLLTNYRKGCQCIFNSTSQITVGNGEIVINDGAGNYAFRRNTGNITVDFTMLDTGVEASSTQYYIYIVADNSATTFTCKISTSASAPSGSIFYRKIGTFFNDGSSNIDAGGVQNIYEFNSLGEWQVKAFTTIYQAPTDGFVCAYGGAGSTVAGFTDSSATPSTLRQQAGEASGSSSCLMMPVRKNDYWEVTSIGGTAVFFIPINQG